MLGVFLNEMVFGSQRHNEIKQLKSDTDKR